MIISALRLKNFHVSLFFLLYSVYFAVEKLLDFLKFVVVEFILRHDEHGHRTVVVVVGRLDIGLRVAEETYGGVELDTVVCLFGVGQLDLKNYLLGLLRQEVEEHGFTEALVAELFVDGEVLDVDEVVESPIGEDAYGVVAVFGYKEMKFAGTTVPETTEGGAFLLGERLFKQALRKVRMVAFC